MYPRPWVMSAAALLISTIDYNDCVGRIGIGRIMRGEIDASESLVRVNMQSQETPLKLIDLSVFDGLTKLKVDRVYMGI